MRTRLAAAVVAALLASACGSTVQTTSTATIGGTGGGEGLGGPGTTTGSTAGPGSSGTTTGLGSGTTGSSGGTTGLGGATGGAGTTGGTPLHGTSAGPSSAPLPSQASNGLGVTASTISIGLSYSPEADSLNSSIGGGAFTSGDEQANLKAIVDEINAHGGIAGRRLVPVFHAYHVTSTDSGGAQDQAACDDWTVDHKVIAVASSSLTDTLVACLRKRGVIFIKPGQIVDSDQKYLQEFSNELLLATMSLDRIFRDQATSFQRQKYFTGWDTVSAAPGTSTKVGVLTYDTDSFTRALRNVIIPGLRAAGHAPAEADVIQVHKIQQQSDTAGTSAQIKSAVLRFQSDGVTHVVLGDASGLILQFFASNARTQNYYPRLGVTSGAAPEAFYEAGLVTAKQLNGLSGNGWLPSLDLPVPAQAAYKNSETKRCLEILKRRTGQQYTSTNAATIALGDCDSLFIFQKAMSFATSLSPAGLLDGFNKIGGSYVSPTVGPTFVSARQHDTALRAWDLNWTPSCTCVRYSNERTVPSL